MIPILRASFTRGSRVAPEPVMRMGSDPQGQASRLTVIVPATNCPPTLEACLGSIKAAVSPPEQLIVVDDPAIKHPALARNVGARDATGDVVVFVDADVTVHPDAFQRIRRAFMEDPGLAALFGSYDD